MLWVTREDARVDRVACAWLIRRFIDPTAKFRFVPDGEVAAFTGLGRVRTFDAPGARYQAQDGVCTFEVLVQQYELTDPALRALTRIVHGADVTRDLYDCPEAAGLRALAHGYALTCASDKERLERQFAVYDALYAWCRARIEARAAA